MAKINLDLVPTASPSLIKRSLALTAASITAAPIYFGRNEAIALWQSDMNASDAGQLALEQLSALRQSFQSIGPRAGLADSFRPAAPALAACCIALRSNPDEPVSQRVLYLLAPLVECATGGSSESDSWLNSARVSIVAASYYAVSHPDGRLTRAIEGLTAASGTTDRFPSKAVIAIGVIVMKGLRRHFPAIHAEVKPVLEGRGEYASSVSNVAGYAVFSKQLAATLSRWWWPF